MLSEVTILLALSASTRTTGPCDLLDRATVTALLGQTSPGTPSGPEPDEDTGGTVRYCTFRTPTGALIVSLVAFASAAEAGKATTRELVTSRMDGDGAILTVEPGLGDKAWWAYTTEGAEFVVQKGSVVLAVAMGGRLPNPPSSYRKALRAATAAALLKL